MRFRPRGVGTRSSGTGTRYSEVSPVGQAKLRQGGRDDKERKRFRTPIFITAPSPGTGTSWRVRYTPLTMSVSISKSSRPLSRPVCQILPKPPLPRHLYLRWHLPLSSRLSPRSLVHPKLPTVSSPTSRGPTSLVVLGSVPPTFPLLRPRRRALVYRLLSRPTPSTPV